MTALAEKIYNEALDLPTNERLSLIDKLLHVSNLSTQAEIDQAWSEEVERREQQIENGTATLIPAEEVFAEINARLAK
jgi:putative addiction module component (TIGR02574 family)